MLESQQTHLLPKGSPLKVSHNYETVSVCHEKILQEDFNDAYSRLLAAGIHLKMLSDFEARVGRRSYWKRPKIHGLRPLLLEHYYLALFLFVITTTMSLLAFAIEVLLGRKIIKRKIERSKIRKSKEFDFI